MNIATSKPAFKLNAAFQTALLAFTVLFGSTAVAQDTLKSAEVPTIKAGDRWMYEQRDPRTGNNAVKFDRHVTAVSATQIEGTENNSKLLMTPDLSVMESSTSVVSGEAKTFSFPLEVGKKWSYNINFVNKINGNKGRWELEAAVVAIERVKVPAGEFDAFKVEYKGFWNNDTTRRNGRLVLSNWYAPSARCVVKSEYEDGYSKWVRQLVEFQLQP